jgi:hypothetical protein
MPRFFKSLLSWMSDFLQPVETEPCTVGDYSDWQSGYDHAKDLHRETEGLR